MYKYLVFFLMLLVASCDTTPQKSEKQNVDGLKESMEKANRYLVNDEETDIEDYIARHGLDVVATGTGLRYVILKQGSERQIKDGDVVAIEYELRSIAGDVIYSSKNEGNKVFKVGEGFVESGLEESMHYLHYQDVAIVIIPSHLGYGLHGDENKIPAYSTLIYTIKIIDIQ